ncbi:MAG: glycoside hydrolase family 3 N-terminal domain-containing protein [Actinomycetota bacterium]
MGRRRGAVARPGPASPPARVRALILALVLAALAAACSGGGDEASPAGVGGTDDAAAADATLVVSTTTTAPPDPGPDPVPALLASLTVEEKIGQLLMPQLFGRSGAATGDAAALNESAHGSASPTDLVTEHHLGGVIYLADNIATAQQVRAFSRDLQNAATGTNGIGLLVAVDQEGGRISRLSDEMSAFPSAADLSGDADQVRVASYVTGQQVQQQGINVVLAPVADVLDPSTPSFIDDRSFGDDAEQVARMVGAAVDGLQDAGVAAAVKHWPGHGATPVDSHRLLPSLDIDRELWEQRERLPFETAIDRDVAIVLVGHLALPQLDASGAPATVSSVLIDELLRRELGFDGVVMTDALNMGAVGSIPERELVVDAVLAGVDIVLIPPSLSEATDALRQAVADGTITEARLDASVTRVLRLKERLGLLPAAG